MPGFTAGAWFGLFAPAATPREVIARLHAEAVRAVESREVRELFERAGFQVIGSTPEQFAQQVRGDIARFTRVAREAGIKPE